MANQRVLDDNENDKSTKDGALDQGSHHEDVLGHILDDTSLDEWDIVPDTQQSVAPPDIVAKEAPGVTAPSDQVSGVQNIQPPEDEWTASAIVAMPEVAAMPEVENAPKEESSLFSFSMMQKFGSELEEPIPTTPPEPIAVEPMPVEPTPVEPTPVEPITASPVSANSSGEPAPTKATETKPSPTIDPLLVPAPPVAIGPNPFLVKIAPIADHSATSPVAETPLTAPVTDTPAAAPVVEPPAHAVETPTQPSSMAASVTQSVTPSTPSLGAPAGQPETTPSAAPSAAPVHSPSAASTRIPALAPTPAMLLAQTQAAPPPLPVAMQPVAPAVPPVVPAPTATATNNNAQPKRKPAATLIFDSFTKSKIGSSGLDLLAPFGEPDKSTSTAANETPAATPAAPPKQRNTARTLIFKAGATVDEMDQSLQPLSNPPQNHATTTGSNATVSVNPSVGPNLAAAIAAYQAGGQIPAATPASTDAAARANSNVIPAHNPVTGGRPIARTMILKSLAKPEPESDELIEPLTEPLIEAPQNGRPSAETIIAAGHAAEAADAQAAQAGRPKIAKRSTAPTLIFKAFTLPSAGENAKPAPLKIIRYDSSKLRNLETNVKPLSIAESIAAAKQASLTDNDKNGPQWLKLFTANPLLKSQRFRQAALLVVLSAALLGCAFALVKSLYSDGQDYHPTNVTSAARDQHHYRSADGGKSFDMLDKDKGSVLIHNGKAIHGKIKTVSDADLVSLATSPVPKREIWLQKTDAGYVDPDGTTLYSASAPELTIAKKIDSYASILAAKYKETKLYPSDAERFERMSPKDFRFTNPFTGHVDQPSVQYKRFAAAEPSWTDHTRSGHAWADEPPFKPGAIHCICLDYCRFFIRGFDRNGSPIYGSVPGVADYIELKDGQNMNPRRIDKITDDKDKTPAVFMVARNPALQMEVALLRQMGLVVPAIILVVALLACGWILFLRRMKNNKADSLANTTKFTMKQ
ncbi:MAG: hypothetical protein JST89_03570 [Cyanobacteria bacterium SZAS-4]|nr:hypothetical protein [Cyanobacteria bacterium SZAS-4]